MKHVILSGVDYIGSNAFSNCKSLQEIIIPQGVTTINPWCFLGCYSLQRVFIPDSVETIRTGAFISCGSLEEIIIPSSVKKVESEAFFECSHLRHIVILNPEIDIDEHAFTCSGIVHSIIEIPAGSKERFRTKFKNESIWNNLHENHFINQSQYSWTLGYIGDVHYQEDEDYEYQNESWKNNTWDAMTDGMYGDYGGNDDYDFLGY